MTSQLSRPFAVLMSRLLVMLESDMHCSRRSFGLAWESPFCERMRVEASADDDVSVGAT
jgi:hypothetical protein